MVPVVSVKILTTPGSCRNRMPISQAAAPLTITLKKGCSSKGDFFYMVWHDRRGGASTHSLFVICSGPASNKKTSALRREQIGHRSPDGFRTAALRRDSREHERYFNPNLRRKSAFSARSFSARSFRSRRFSSSSWMNSPYSATWSVANRGAAANAFFHR